MWLIESALAADEQGARGDARRRAEGDRPRRASRPDRAIAEGDDVAAAETELIRALESEAESLRKLNPFLVLGVGYEATDADVRAAFGELTKRYHPDRFARYQSTELRQIAAEIFILIRDAYRKLGDEAGRRRCSPRSARHPRASPARARRPATRCAALDHRAVAGRPRQSRPIPRPQAPPPRADAATARRAGAAASPRLTTRRPSRVRTTRRPSPAPRPSAPRED